MGWKHIAGRYCSFEIHRPEFERLAQSHTVEQWSCDIQDVTGLSASKSDLTKFKSLDDMVEANSQEMIDAITEEKLHKNLEHDEIRILHREAPSDYFACYLWDGRVFLMNSGGSHHFAAARYIASRIGCTVPLRGKLSIHSIDQLAVAELRRVFDMYVISDEAAASNGFHDAMESFRATYFWHYLPRPYEHARAIFLPKKEPRSMKASNILRDSGFFDLGKHLTSLCERQSASPVSTN